MADMIYISHPEVMIDPGIPVPEWHLSDIGIERMRLTSTEPFVADCQSVWSSTEKKAQMGAQILADALSIPIEEHEGLGENDRSATGFVGPPHFWEIVDAFFANPEESIEGWETARDAQDRVMATLRLVAEKAPAGNIAVVAHGGVGGLTMAALKGAEISRSFDQPDQGNWFSFDRDTFKLKQGWRNLPRAESN